MSYSENLQRRLRQGLKQRADDPFIVVVPPHPMKYPKHEGSKGSVFGGICNLTRCNNTRAEAYNMGTFGYYCAFCANGINKGHENPLCVRVDHNLTHDEMNEYYERDSRTVREFR